MQIASISSDARPNDFWQVHVLWSRENGGQRRFFFPSTFAEVVHTPKEKLTLCVFDQHHLDASG